MSEQNLLNRIYDLLKQKFSQRCNFSSIQKVNSKPVSRKRAESQPAPEVIKWYYDVQKLGTEGVPDDVSAEDFRKRAEYICANKNMWPGNGSYTPRKGFADHNEMEGACWAMGLDEKDSA